MSQNNLFPSGDFHYTPSNNLTALQNVYVPQSDSIHNVILEMREELKSLKSEISGIKNEMKELANETKRSFTKLTEEVIAIKLEGRKQQKDKISADQYKDMEQLPLTNINDFKAFDDQLQKQEEKLMQFKHFIARTGGDGPAEFIRSAVRKVFTDDLASLYTWKGTSAKPSVEKTFSVATIKNVCHLRFNCTDKDMNAVLQKFFMHATDRIKRQRVP